MHCGFNVKADEKIGIGVQRHKTNNKNAVIVECNIFVKLRQGSGKVRQGKARKGKDVER